MHPDQLVMRSENENFGLKGSWDRQRQVLTQLYRTPNREVPEVRA